MEQKVYFLVCAAVFFLVATAHLTRLIVGWDITIAGWSAPGWISVPGFVASGALSVWGFVLALRRRPAA